MAKTNYINPVGCGCRLVKANIQNTSGLDKDFYTGQIEYCPTHAAAEEMKAALEDIYIDLIKKTTQYGNGEIGIVDIILAMSRAIEHGRKALASTQEAQDGAD